MSGLVNLVKDVADSLVDTIHDAFQGDLGSIVTVAAMAYGVYTAGAGAGWWGEEALGKAATDQAVNTGLSQAGALDPAAAGVGVGEVGSVDAAISGTLEGVPNMTGSSSFGTMEGLEAASDGLMSFDGVQLADSGQIMTDTPMFEGMAADPSQYSIQPTPTGAGTAPTTGGFNMEADVASKTAAAAPAPAVGTPGVSTLNPAAQAADINKALGMGLDPKAAQYMTSSQIQDFIGAGETGLIDSKWAVPGAIMGGQALSGYAQSREMRKIEQDRIKEEERKEGNIQAYGMRRNGEQTAINPGRGLLDMNNNLDFSSRSTPTYSRG